jgi:hypothetical protein
VWRDAARRLDDERHHARFFLEERVVVRAHVRRDVALARLSEVKSYESTRTGSTHAAPKTSPLATGTLSQDLAATHPAGSHHKVPRPSHYSGAAGHFGTRGLEALACTRTHHAHAVAHRTTRPRLAP